MRPIPDSRFWILGLAVTLAGCGAPYEIRLSDGRSVSRGPLFFYGWADPPLVPGTRLIDARPGQRLVLFNDEWEAIVDVGAECPVLVREGEGARTPTNVELQALDAVLPGWPLVPSPHPEQYAEEQRLERRFPSHIEARFHRLEPAAAVEFALGDAPAGWLALRGRTSCLMDVATRAPVSALGRILDGAQALDEEDRGWVLRLMIERTDLTSAHLVRIAGAGAPVGAARHKAADEAVCLAAIEEIAKEPLSSKRRDGLIDILDSPGVTPRVREEILKVPLAYPEDRDAVRKKAEATSPR